MAERALNEMGVVYVGLGRSYEAWVCLAGVPTATTNYEF